jgi:hypothetical protein
MVYYCFTNIKGDHGLTIRNGGFNHRRMHEQWINDDRWIGWGKSQPETGWLRNPQPENFVGFL